MNLQSAGRVGAESERRAFSMAEIIVDGVVHGIGMVHAIGLGTVLIVFAAIGTARPELPSLILYVATLLLVLAVSLTFNLAPVSTFKRIMARADQAAIFLFTPEPTRRSLPSSAARRRSGCWRASSGVQPLSASR